MKALIFIALGGATGAVLRYWISSATYQLLGRNFPYGTLMVNVLGSLAIGMLAILLVDKYNFSHHVKLGMTVGVLSALTTFSTFSLETVELIQEGLVQKAMLNVLLNVVACISAVWVGTLWAKSMI